MATSAKLAEGLFTISGGHREMWGFVVQKHIEKREHVVNFLLHRKMNVWVLIVDKIKEKDGVMLRVKKAKCVVHITPVKQYFRFLILFQPHLLMVPHEQIGKRSMTPSFSLILSTISTQTFILRWRRKLTTCSLFSMCFWTTKPHISL